MNFDDEDKAIILLCSLASSYDHLVTTLTYGKETITFNSISSTLLQHIKNCQSVEEYEGNSGEGLFVEGGQDYGRGNGKTMGYGKKKSFKSKDRKIEECYGCNQIGH